MMTQERPGAIEKTRRNTVWKRRLWLIRKSPLTLIGGAIMLIMLFLMIFSPWLVPHDPNAIDLTARLQAPSLSHWFGTDEVGRDLFSRVLIGSQQSIAAGLAVVLIAPALPCPVRNQVSVDKPDWSTVPFIMADQGPVRRRIELWFRRQKISNPSIYATVSGHEAMVSMVALGCGVALLPEVVLENSPEPVRNRVMILERSDEQTPFELGVCAQKKRLHEPLIDAFWKILPNH